MYKWSILILALTPVQEAFPCCLSNKTIIIKKVWFEKEKYWNNGILQWHWRHTFWPFLLFLKWASLCLIHNDDPETNVISTQTFGFLFNLLNMRLLFYRWSVQSVLFSCSDSSRNYWEYFIIYGKLIFQFFLFNFFHFQPI